VTCHLDDAEVGRAVRPPERVVDETSDVGTHRGRNGECEAAGLAVGLDRLPVELDEKARRTEEDLQRKDRIRPIGFLWPDQSLGWRLSAEVEDELEAVTAACAARASRPARGRPMPLQSGHRQAASPQFPLQSSSARRRARATIVRVGLA
jgi:hypothetical protein